MKRPSIQDVAQEAGISKTSVSNYLNGKDSKMSKQTRLLIEQAVKKLNYTPSFGARRMYSKTGSHTLCVIIRHDMNYMFHTRFFAQVMKGIDDVCGQLGYRVLLFSSHHPNQGADIDYTLSLGGGIVDGFLLFELEENDPYLTAFEKSGVPYICFGYPENRNLTSWIATDQAQGGELATAHLVQHGHRRIAIFPGQRKSLVAQQRLRGYLQVLQKERISEDTGLIQYGYSPEADLYPEYVRLLEMENGPTAFIFPQAQLPAYCRALESTGRITDKPAVILADYFPADEYETTEYTYVKGFVRQVGLHGAERLINKIEGKAAGKGELFPAELVTGTSCGCKTGGTK